MSKELRGGKVVRLADARALSQAQAFRLAIAWSVMARRENAPNPEQGQLQILLEPSKTILQDFVFHNIASPDYLDEAHCGHTTLPSCLTDEPGLFWIGLVTHDAACVDDTNLLALTLVTRDNSGKIRVLPIKSGGFFGLDLRL